MRKKILKKIILLCTLIITISISAQNATFNNAGGDNLWSNTANWNTGELPTGIATIAANVTLDIDITLQQITTPNELAENITISGANTITIENGVSFFVNNKLNGVLSIGCKIVNAQSGKSIATSFFPNNQLVFADGSELTLNENTTIRNLSANAMEFNGMLKGAKNFLVANTPNHGGIVFGSTANNATYEGQIICFKDAVISNVELPNLFLPSTSNGIQFNNTAGSLTINKPNTVEGSISRTNSNAGTSVVTINANQTNMSLLAVSATSNNVILDLVIGESVTELVFNSLVLNTEETSGILNIIGFKDDVLKFGSTLNQEQLDAIKIDGTATAGFLAQRENGYITKAITLSLDSNILENTSIYPNPTSNILYIISPINSSINVFNVLGKKVKSISNTSGKLELTVSDLSSGIYLVKISSANKLKTTKLIIN